MSLTDLQRQDAQRLMDTVNSDAFDAAFEDGRDPFIGEHLRATAEWFALRGYRHIDRAPGVALPSIVPGDLVILPANWPGDCVGVVTDTGTIAVVGDVDAADFPTTMDEWLAAYDVSEFVVLRAS